ncbi:hypothetical protein GCM10010206_43600 [Streptomyces cinerochromogenes]|nr:hypothetical protein GCM10010206_43600 [Streptomyces cinerochromogenes]
MAPAAYVTGLAVRARSRRSAAGPPEQGLERMRVRRRVRRAGQGRQGPPQQRLDVGDAVPVDHGPHRAVPVRHPLPAFQPGPVDVGADQAGQRGEVAAGRLAPGADPFRDHAEDVGVPAHVPDGGLDVVQLGGEGGFEAVPVVDRDQGQAGAEDGSVQQVHRHRRRRVAPVALQPAAAVDPHHGRYGAPARRQVHVEQARPVAGRGGVTQPVETAHPVGAGHGGQRGPERGRGPVGFEPGGGC